MSISVFGYKLNSFIFYISDIYHSRFQPYISENFGPTASASINVPQTVLPDSYNRDRDHYEPSALKNGFGNNDNKYKFVDSSFSKDIRWEFGFKPPFSPSIAIDEFGNPLNEES